MSIDQVELQLMSDERLIAQIRARQLRSLEQLDTAQVHSGDGSKNLSDWVGIRLDMSLDSARSLVRTMRRTSDKTHLREGLESGRISFDRAEALSRLESEKTFLEHLDIASVRRVAADRVEVTADDEIAATAERFLVIQPNLDESWWKLWGGLDGVTGAVVDRALSERADSLPDLPDGTRGSGSWRRATALYELASGGESPKAQVSVFIDANEATPTDGRAGVRLEAGPRVGAQALSAILCDAVTEVIVTTGDGVPMQYGRKSRQTPPSLRQSVLARNSGHCEVFGCNSRYRVEVHHKIPWSQGGPTDPDNLVAVCWFHHHVAIHERGFEVHNDDHGRVTLRSRVCERAPPAS